MKTPIKKGFCHKNPADRYSVEALRERLQSDDRAALFVFSLAGVNPDLIEATAKAGREVATGKPCPICGGADRFKIVRPKDGAGVWAGYCRQCDGGRAYSPIDLYMTVKGLDLNAAVREIVNALDGAPPTSNGYPMRKNDAMTMRENDVVIQSAQGTRARIAPTTSANESKHGRRVMPENAVEKRFTDHVYRDANGAPVYNARRVDFFDPSTGERVAIDRNGNVKDKDFLALIPNGRGGWIASKGMNRAAIPPYNYPELLAPECGRVFIVEGEKAADALGRALADMGGESVATTTGAGGNAGSWEQWGPECLTGKAVFILADNDGPGMKAANDAAEAAARAGASVMLVTFGETPTGNPAPAGYDVADYLDDLATTAPELEPLEQIIARAAPFIPSASVSPLQGKADRQGGEPAPDRQRHDHAEADPADPIERRRIREETQQRRADDLETLFTLPPYPVEAIPESLLEYAQFYAAKFNAPVSTPIKQALASFSGLVCRLYPMTAPAVGYTERRPLRCNLAVLVVGDSGTGKSPLFEAMFEPIAELQAGIERAQERLNAEFSKAKTAQENAKLEKKKLVSKLKRTENPGKKEEIEKQLDDLDDVIFSAVKEPRRQQELYFDPSTPEGVLDGVELNLLCGYANAPILATDEAADTFQTTYNPMGTLALLKKYSKLEDGARFKTKLATKKASGDNSNPEPRLAAFNLAIQPEVLNEVFKHDALRRQGFFNRFLIDEQSPNFTAEIQDIPLDENTRKRYFRPFEAAFLTCRFYDKQNRDDDGAPKQIVEIDAFGRRVPIMRAQSYRLDESAGEPGAPSALNVFQSFRSYCRGKQADYYRLGNKTLVSFYAKLQKIVFKIAVLFRTWEALERKPGAWVELGDETADYLPAPIIDANLMRRAVAVATWDGLKRETVGAYLDSLNPKGEGGAGLPIIAQKILDILADDPEKPFTKSEITRKLHGLGEKRNARVFLRGIQKLIDEGLARETRERRGNNDRVLYQYVKFENAAEADADAGEDLEGGAE